MYVRIVAASSGLLISVDSLAHKYMHISCDNSQVASYNITARMRVSIRTAVVKRSWDTRHPTAPSYMNGRMDAHQQT